MLSIFFYEALIKNGDPYENRTRVTAVKGRCLNRLTNGPFLNVLNKTRFIITSFFSKRKCFSKLFLKKVILYKILKCHLYDRDIILCIYFPIKMLLKKGKKNGSEGRTRTCDLPVNSRMLYQLSYFGTLLLSESLKYIYNYNNL